MTGNKFIILLIIIFGVIYSALKSIEITHRKKYDAVKFKEFLDEHNCNESMKGKL